MELFIFHTCMGFYSQTRPRIEPNVLGYDIKVHLAAIFKSETVITPIYIPHLEKYTLTLEGFYVPNIDIELTLFHTSLKLKHTSNGDRKGWYYTELSAFKEHFINQHKFL